MSFLQIENSYRQQGFKIIAGIDEVGRGCLAGPLVAGAVILNQGDKLVGVNDSKLLSKKKREELFERIISSATCFSFGQVEAEEIDEIGIANANFLAFERALKNLTVKPDFVLADYFNFDSLPYPSKGIFGGDKKVRTIASASIVAKVYRDGLMKKYHDKFPQYGFDTHVGYGTLKHREAIKKYGPCQLHRQSFKLI